MKILMLTDFYPPMVGGIESYVATLSKHLVSRGYEIAVCTVKQRGLKPFEIDDGVQVHRLKALYQRVPLTSLNPLRYIFILPLISRATILIILWSKARNEDINAL